MQMQKSLDKMLAALSPLKLYSLDENSFVHDELQCYSKAMSLLFERIEPLRQNIFVTIANEETLQRMEKMLDLPVANTLDENRRSIILSKLAIAPGDFNIAGILRSINAAGLNAKIAENTATKTLRIYDATIIGGFSTLDEVKRQTNAMLPAHLGCEFDIGTLTWAQFDAKDLTFARLNSLNFTWEWFDLNGEKI